jgi:hypothetical protein
MNYYQFMDIVKEHFPDALISEGIGGELMIETGLMNVDHKLDSELVSSTSGFEG